MTPKNKKTIIKGNMKSKREKAYKVYSEDNEGFGENGGTTLKKMSTYSRKASASKNPSTDPINLNSK